MSDNIYYDRAVYRAEQKAKAEQQKRNLERNVCDNKNRQYYEKDIRNTGR